MSVHRMKIIRKLVRLSIEAIYYNAMPSYRNKATDPYSELAVKFPKLKNVFLPHVMYPTEVDVNRSGNGMHFLFLFFKTFIQTLQQYSYMFDDVSSLDMFWSEKHANTGTESKHLIVEHGWLPRSSYQISETGANGRGAPCQLKENSSYLQIYGGIDQVREQLQRLNNAYYNGSGNSGDRVVANEYIVAPMQLGNDLNLRDSSTRFSKYYGCENATGMFLSEFVKVINEHDLPVPVYFTQHPVDKDIHDIELRDGDQYFSTSSGISTLELIRNPKCLGVVSINSNVVHEALCLNVPCCVMGRLFWREDELSPFETNPSRFFEVPPTKPHDDSNVMEYVAKLLCHQWYLTDMQNPLIVREIVLNNRDLIPFQIRKQFSVT